MLKNFRDLGGLPAAGGKTVRYNRLLRGRALYGISDRDIQKLRKKGLSTVIDLRTTQERQEKPDMELEGVNNLHMPIFTEEKAGISRDRKSTSFSSFKKMPPMANVYKTMVQGECVENLVQVLKTILTGVSEGNSVFFHCSAGKDRTGLVSFLLLSFLGVEREVALRDYLLTNHGQGPFRFAAGIFVFLISWRPRYAKKIRSFIRADKNYIEGAVEILEQRYGSLQNFFDSEFGFSSAETEKILTTFLE